LFPYDDSSLPDVAAGPVALDDTPLLRSLGARLPFEASEAVPFTFAPVDTLPFKSAAALSFRSIDPLPIALPFTSVDGLLFKSAAAFPFEGGVAWSITDAALSFPIVLRALDVTMSFAFAVPAMPRADATAATCIHCLGFICCSPFEGTPGREAHEPMSPLSKASGRHAAGPVRIAL
jgi:hypothetical protein